MTLPHDLNQGLLATTAAFVRQSGYLSLNPKCVSVQAASSDEVPHLFEQHRVRHRGWVKTYCWLVV